MMIKKILKFLSKLFNPKKKKRTAAPVRQPINQITQPMQSIQTDKDDQKLNLTKNSSVAAAKIEQELKAESEPKIKSEIKPKLESKPEVESKSKVESEVKIESKVQESKVESKPEIKSEVKSESKVQESKIEPKPEIKVEIKSESKVQESKAESKPEIKPEVKSESKVQESKAELKPEIKVEVKSESKVQESKVASKPEIKPEVKAESKSDLELESKLEKETEPKPKANIVTVHNVPSEKVIDYIRAKAMVGDIVIPNSMNEIPARLFDGNKKITSVTIPGTVKRIGDRAFAECVNLEKVILKEGIEEIKSNVFTGCEKLRSVTYPDSVKKYQGWTFWRTKLTEPVMNVSKTILIFCPKSVSGKEWSVPDTVKIISWQAFIEDKDLEVLHLPKGLEVIERMAFIECGLKKITIPYSVREIGAEAFWRCEQLEEVNILNPNTKVGVNAFSKCKNLKEIKYGKPNKPSKIVRLKD